MGADDLKPRVAVLMATFNRHSQTMACLKSVTEQEDQPAILHFFIVDDNSTDGTPTAITERFANATVLAGTGRLFWAASMALAGRTAAVTDPDFYLWLNDDTVLMPDALQKMFLLSTRHPDCIIVGAMTSSNGCDATYGGRFRTGRHPLRVTSPEIRSTAQRVDTFNGNCVLIPRVVRNIVGPIDGSYAHGFADYDYGYRAAGHGVEAWQVAGSMGTCDENGFTHNTSLLQAYRLLRSPKGLPIRSHTRFLRRHAQWEWPLLVVWGQFNFLLRAIRPSSRE